jgi:pyrroline-5-carboxylate reductase
MIAILGIGHLGEAILTGLLRVGLEPPGLAGSALPAGRAAELTRRYGVPVAPDNIAPATGASIALLAVPPGQAVAVAAEIVPVLATEATVVSLAAGVTLGELEHALPPGTAVIRAMTNTAIEVDQAATAITPGGGVTEAQLTAVTDVFTRLGAVVQVPESDLDMVTAVAGSGPAFIYYLTQAMIDAATAEGMTAPAAWTLVTQVLYGAAVTLSNTGADPADLLAGIATPGGTTQAGLDQLEADETAAAIRAAVRAAAARSRQLAVPARAS